MSGVELKEHSIDMKWGPRLMGGVDQRHGFDICVYEDFISGVGMEMKI